MFAEPPPALRKNFPLWMEFLLLSRREHTLTTNNKAQATLRAKGASKGFTAAAANPKVYARAPHEGIMNGKRLQRENWPREELFSVSVAS